MTNIHSSQAKHHLKVGWVHKESEYDESTNTWSKDIGLEKLPASRVHELQWQREINGEIWDELIDEFLHYRRTQNMSHGQRNWSILKEGSKMSEKKWRLPKYCPSHWLLSANIAESLMQAVHAKSTVYFPNILVDVLDLPRWTLVIGQPRRMLPTMPGEGWQQGDRLHARFAGLPASDLRSLNHKENKEMSYCSVMGLWESCCWD